MKKIFSAVSMMMLVAITAGLLYDLSFIIEKLGIQSYEYLLVNIVCYLLIVIASITIMHRGHSVFVNKLTGICTMLFCIFYAELLFGLIMFKSSQMVSMSWAVLLIILSLLLVTYAADIVMDLTLNCSLDEFMQKIKGQIPAQMENIKPDLAAIENKEEQSMHTFDAKRAVCDCVNWIQNWFELNGKGCNAVIGISGGKDSTVVAALCAKALGPEHVMGVMLPNGEQSDINDSREIIDFLCINGIELNIQDTANAILKQMRNLNIRTIYTGMRPELTRQAKENLPPRLRMAALYLVAQSCNGRVSNNCNLSENWIGYSTIYGDTAGDFSPVSNFTVTEVIEMGRELGIPEKFLVKPPADGLSGQTDEDKIGFTYAVLDRYLRTGEIDDIEVRNKIDAMHERNAFKHKPMAAFPFKSSPLGHSIGGAFWTESEFGPFNDRTAGQLQDEGFDQYNIFIQKDGKLTVWAHDETEAMRISELITAKEIDAYAHFDNAYVTGVMYSI